MSPSATNWVPDYVLAMQGYIPGYEAGNHDDARAYADRNRPAPGTPEYKALMQTVRNNYFQRTPPEPGRMRMVVFMLHPVVAHPFG